MKLLPTQLSTSYCHFTQNVRTFQWVPFSGMLSMCVPPSGRAPKYQMHTRCEMAAFWDETPYSVLKVNATEGTHCLHHHNLARGSTQHVLLKHW